MKTPKGFVTIDEAFKLLGVARSTLFEMVKKKEIKSLKIKRWRFVSKAEIERYLDGR